MKLNKEHLTASVWCALVSIFLSANLLRAALPEEFVVQARVVVEENPFALNISWDSAPDASAYIVYRKQLEDPVWTELGAAGANGYRDAEVLPGVGYEYKIEKRMTSGEYTGYGYLYSGGYLPVADHRGSILLVIENSIAEALGPEIDLLELDLIGDGWRVFRSVVRAIDSPPSVKEVIRQRYNVEEDLKSVFLIGNVPVPYSGEMAPDEHSNHVGAWPADAYYADIDGEWTDHTVNRTTAEKSWNWNVPGDGKFDQSTIPSKVELMVGRVDLSRLTCFANKTPSLSEIDLTRRYFAKNHRYRQAVTPVGTRSLIFEKFGGSSFEPISSAAWRNLAPISGSDLDIIGPGEFFYYTSTNTYLWSSVTSGGNYTMSDNVGSADLFALNSVNVVFSMYLGSYFGDWDNESNFLRAALGAPGSTLVSIYSGKPKWVCHHMALGETIGFSTRVTQSNNKNGLYLPISTGAGQPHIALHGDPTLRAHYIAPVRNLVGSRGADGLRLEWEPSTSSDARGYYIYKSAAPKGPYTRITPLMVQGNQFLDQSYNDGETYLVKAVALTRTPSGSYWNASQGAFYPDPIQSSSDALPPAPPRSLSVLSTSSGSVTIGWVAGSGNHSGFTIEKKTLDSDTFALIATVDALTTSFRDPNVGLGELLEYRVKAFNQSGDFSYSTPLPVLVRSGNADFLYYDKSTRGDWVGTYGSEGHDVFQSAAELPDYVRVTVRNATLFASGPTADRRALFREVPYGYWFTCWYSYDTFIVDLDFQDEKVHQLAFYTVDWDRKGRGLEWEIVDSFTGERLDHRVIADLKEGLYLVYALSGRVSIRLTPTTEFNIPLLGIFFDEPRVKKPILFPPPGTFNGKTAVSVSGLIPDASYHYTLDGTVPTPASPKYSGPLTITGSASVRVRGFRNGLIESEVAAAEYVNTVINRIGLIRWDDQTRGDWSGTFGAEGQLIVGGSRALPVYAEALLSGHSEWTWENDPADPRALLKAGPGEGRIASCWYSADSFSINLSVFDRKSRALSLYFLDWDRSGREQRIELIDASGQVVDQYTLKSFEEGRYLVLNVQGTCQIRITRLQGPNAVLNGVFWDPAPSELNAPAPVPLEKPAIRDNQLQFTVAGQPGHQICLDVSADLRSWQCVSTNLFVQPTLLITRDREKDVAAEFVRTHFIE